jgi:proteasome assembly chaperone (PAC2) family protein
VLVGAFRGWNDGAQGASLATSFLAQAWEARRFANIDPEEFYDFQATRPHVALEDGITRRIDWPDTVFYHAPIPGADRDAVLMLGIEPNLRWRTFCDEIVELAGELDVELVVTLGALLADVPHTRPVQLIGTATDLSLIERFDLERSRYEGPTGIVGVLQHAFTHVDIPSASLWAAVPGYASQLPSPKAAMALVERACSMMGTPAPVAALAEQIADYDARVGALIADDEDLVTYVARLESMLDEMDVDELDLDLDETTDELDLSDPGALVQEVERFLRERDDDT